MALLNLKNKKTLSQAKGTSKDVTIAKKVAVIGAFLPTTTSNVIIRPRVTEKATMLSEQGRQVHVFEVSRSANKKTVSDAILHLYKVRPEKVSILKIPPKSSFARGRRSAGHTYYKAYVYLKKGETIEVV